MRLALVLALALAACARDPECLSDLACGDDEVCIRGACESLGRSCTSDTTCTAPDTCNAGSCLRPGRCLDNGNCRPDEVCVGGLCLPQRCDDDSCPAGSVCDTAGGSCTLAPCADDEGCPPPLVCDPALRQCRAIGTVPFAERCNDVDDDLDGNVDEGFDVGVVCVVGQGTCARAGRVVCTADETASTCDAVAGPASAEFCDGLDNDCDGEVDDDFPTLGGPCLAGLGVCTAGLVVCSAEGGTECSPLVEAVTERCNGVDDDCDGEVDDDYPGLGLSCIVGVGACRAIGLWTCTPNGASMYCDAPSPPPSAEVCDRQDNDCDGEIDEGLALCAPP